MTIDKLKLEHGEIAVDYTGLFESFRVVTRDEAQTSLYAAAADVAVLARIALGIVTERAGFVSISFSHGDKPGTRVLLSMPTIVGDPAKIACPKIDAAIMTDFETGLAIEGDPRNIYNAAVVRLEKEIIEFVKGKRAQMALPFDYSPQERELDRRAKAFLGQKGEEDSLEDAEAEPRGNVFDFQAAASSAQ